MGKFVLDGKELEFFPGENIVDAAKRFGVEIPVFCYHPGLSVVAQCRMCAVEIEKMPKIQTACSTKCAEGMVVNTQSPSVKAARQSVMEFLLINHPLDCPICDKSGECDLQDNSYKYGNSYMRTSEDRRTYVDLDMGPIIKKNMNRCIHCTRCIRFGDEVAGIREMVALQRGNNTEISTIEGRPLETEYAGNYADICPTGSLTLKDFRFSRRVWFLKKTPSVCQGCSKGCNIELHSEREHVFRTVPRENLDVNRYWICDEGRFEFHMIHDESRILAPQASSKAGGAMPWGEALSLAKNTVNRGAVTVVVGGDLSLEEMLAIKSFADSRVNIQQVLQFGCKSVQSSVEDAPEDQLLRRKSKVPNLKGAESFGWKSAWKEAVLGDTVLVFSGGKAEVPVFPGKRVIGIGVFANQVPQVASFDLILPGPSFAEKSGSFINFEGKSQKFNQAIRPLGKVKPIPEILMHLAHETREAVNQGVGA